MSVSPSYIAETASQHLVAGVPFAFAQESVGSTLSSLVGNKFDSIEAVYIIDQQGHLCGLVRLRDLIVAPRTQKLGEIMTSSQPLTVYAHEDQERVAGLAIQRSLIDVPVIDRQGFFWCSSSPSFVGYFKTRAY